LWSWRESIEIVQECHPARDKKYEEFVGSVVDAGESIFQLYGGDFDDMDGVFEFILHVWGWLGCLVHDVSSK